VTPEPIAWLASLLATVPFVARRRRNAGEDRGPDVPGVGPAGYGCTITAQELERLRRQVPRY